MSRFEKGLRKLIKENRIDELAFYIDRKLSSTMFRRKNEEEFLRLLPVIIENTNNNNCRWIRDHYFCIFRDKRFVETIINNIDKFCFQNSDYILDIILSNIQNMSREMLDYNMVKKLDDSVLECSCELKGSTIEKLYFINHVLSDKYPDLAGYMFKNYFLNERTFYETIRCPFIMNNIDKRIVFKNIDYILEEIRPTYLFGLKEFCKENREAFLKIRGKIAEDPEKYVKAYIKREYENFMVNEDVVKREYSDKLDEALEEAYQTIKDTCKNEGVDILDIEGLPEGKYSKPILIGNKVVKIGKQRGTPSFPNNPYINAIGKRKEIIINEENSFVIESNEFLDTKSLITDEELYQLYKNFRKLRLVWIDVANRNVGRLLKENTFSWKEELSLTDEELGLKEYRGPRFVLKKGNIVTSDNDLIYDEEELKKLFNGRRIDNPNVRRFEKRYQEELMSDSIVEGFVMNTGNTGSGIDVVGRRK